MPGIHEPVSKDRAAGFRKIIINYIPREDMVESKSLKLYLFSFRNHGDFHEDCVNIIMKDLVKLMNPRYLEVKGIFMPRGGISILPLPTMPTRSMRRCARQGCWLISQKF